jgi:undecaprenyl diphosphate synthase
MSAKAQKLTHLGIILDGNRRWARAQGLPVVEGHRKGLEVFKDVSLAAFDRGVEVVSAYIFSTENHNRPQDEVSYLMKLVVKAVEKHLDTFHDAGIKLVHLGSRERLSSTVLDAIDRSVEKTKKNTKGTLALCFNYGGQQEIIDAVNAAVQGGQKKLDAKTIEQHLYANKVPPVDLILRTSGEQRTSGFMLWRAAYAEMLFVQKMWPDFTVEDLDVAIECYENRERRYGK